MAQIITLGEAQSFAVLGGAAVTNTGPTTILGNLGVSPGTSVTGFPPGTVSGGAIHAGDAMAAQAHADAATAYTALAGATPTTDLSGQDLGGKTLTPGVYHFSNSASLSGNLTLDTTNDPKGTFIFQIGSTLTTGVGTDVIVLGAQADPNIYWQVGSSATLGTNSVFTGSVLALTSITLNSGAAITDGRALAQNGSVSLDTNLILFSTTDYWSGKANALWSGANWSPDASGSSSSTLVSGADVIFSVTGVPSQNLNTTLDTDQTIASLTVNDPGDVTISGPHTLSITGTGITINSTAGLTTINSDLELSGTPDVIVNNEAGLVINGIVGGSVGLNKAGIGLLILTGENTYTGGTTIAAGSLQIGNGGTTGSILGDVVDDGNLFFYRSDAVTFPGVISGTGILSKGGAGTLTLTGANTYSGGTNIFTGVVVAGADSALGSSNVRLFNGTLRIAPGVTVANEVIFVVGGVLENEGTLNNNVTDAPTSTQGVINSGIINGSVTLGGTTDYVWLINGSKITGNVDLGSTKNSTLILDGAGEDSLSQAVTGSITNHGFLSKIGSGAWTIDRPLDAPMGTQVQDGTLVLAAALNTLKVEIAKGAVLQFNSGGSTSDLVDDGTVVFAGSGATTYASLVTGSGNLIQDGPGTTTLSGRNTYSGGTIINAGTLLVNNAQALGTGNVTVNGGVFGTDSQPINVLGNYTQNSGGTLQLHIAGRSAGQFDTLNVSGTTSLNGNLRLLNQGYKPQNGDKLQLVTAGGLVSGRFSTLQNPFTLAAGFDTINLVYASNSVTLEFLDLNRPGPLPSPIIISTTDFASFAFTPNQSAVGAALNRVQLTNANVNRVQLATASGRLIDFLNSEPFANLPRDFDRISPDSLSAVYAISFSAANVQASNLDERFSEIRHGSNGFSSSLSVTNAPGTLVEGKDGKTMIESNKNILAPSPENKWGVWISGNGDYVNVSGDGNGHGYDFTTGGVAFGLDYRLTPNLAVGVAGSYAHTWTDLTGSGKIDADSGRAGLYATYFQGGLYLSGYAGGGYSSYSTRRDTLGGTASGSSDSGEFDGYFGGGYEFHQGGFAFGPIASVQYTYLAVSGSNETGSLAPLHIQSKSHDSLRSNVGLSVSYTTHLGKIQVTPSVRASWQHEYLYSNIPVTAQFDSGAASSFTVTGPSAGQDSAIVNAGVNVQWTPTIGTYFGYNGQLGGDNYDSQGGTCSVHVDF